VTPRTASRLCVCGHARGAHHLRPSVRRPHCTVAGCGCMVFVAAPPRHDLRCEDRDAIRRWAMVWLLLGAGQPVADVAAALGITIYRARELEVSYQRRLAERESRAAYWAEPWACRLRAQGALP